MNPDTLSDDIKSRAKSEREAGGLIMINYGIPYISIRMSNGEDYYFQGHEAEDQILYVNDTIKECNLTVTREDFLLASAQNW